MATDAAAACAKGTAESGLASTPEALLRYVDDLRAAVAAAYPSGLPAFDPAHLLLHDDASNTLLAGIMGTDYMPPLTSELWWAGKEFVRGQTVADRLGRNEKTKVIARLQRPGAGAPVREPVVSEDERAAMMACYFKKQEAEKALAEDREDGYMNAAWADTRALKSSLLSTTNVSWRAGGAR